MKTADHLTKIRGPAAKIMKGALQAEPAMTRGETALAVVCIVVGLVALCFLGWGVV